MLRYIRPYWPEYVFAILMGLIKFLAPFLVIRLFGSAIDVLTLVAAGEISSEDAWSRLVRIFLYGCVVLVSIPVPVYLRSVIGARVNNKVIRDIRCDLYSHIQKLSHSFFDRNRSGALTSRIISDVETIKPFLGKTIIQLWMNLGVVVAVLFYLFSRNVYIGLLSVSLIPLQLLIFHTMGKKIKRLTKNIRSKLARMSGNTQEVLAGATIVKAFTQEQDEIRKFEDEAEALVSMGIENARFSGVTQIATSALGMLAPLLVILIGGRLALLRPETLPVSLIVEFVMMQGRLYDPFDRLSEAQVVTANALGAVDRIFEIHDISPEIKDKKGAKAIDSVNGDIEFKNVSFSYDKNSGEKVLADFNLEIPARSTVALVGPSGSGKTTVIRMLNRFYDPDKGSITIDGTDLRDFKIRSLRSQIGLVPQDPVLFSGAIYDNILYGKPGAEPGEVYEAAERADAVEFIEAMPDGFYSRVSEAGSSLSGGQKQRIAIARAFLKNPPVLILDEATSALDSESELRIQGALDELVRGRTTVIIAHRLSTIVNSDKIVVLLGGKVVEQGSHPELMLNGKLYAELCRNQLDREIFGINE